MNLLNALLLEFVLLAKKIGKLFKIINTRLKSVTYLVVDNIIEIIFIVIRLRPSFALKSFHRKKKRKFNRDEVLSLAFFAKKKMHSVYKFLSGCFVLCSTILYFLQRVTIIMPILFFLFVVLVLVKDQIVEFRIKKGLFGTNRTEARELIDFIIKNSDNLDFTDSNGNLRRALLPEAKDAAEEHIPGTLGEEARA